MMMMMMMMVYSTIVTSDDSGETAIDATHESKTIEEEVYNNGFYLEVSTAIPISAAISVSAAVRGDEDDNDAPLEDPFLSDKLKEPFASYTGFGPQASIYDQQTLGSRLFLFASLHQIDWAIYSFIPPTLSQTRLELQLQLAHEDHKEVSGSVHLLKKFVHKHVPRLTTQVLID